MGHDDNDATLKLDELIERYKLDYNPKLTFITSSPRSDMGKGTITSMLMLISQEEGHRRGIIKFDGHPNTNKDGRHLWEDDFLVYGEYNPDINFGREHYIIGGDLYKKFVSKFGECKEYLALRPHVAKFLISEIVCSRNKRDRNISILRLVV